MVSSLRAGPEPRWTVRLATFLAWALALFCVAYWVLHWLATPVGVPQVPVAPRTVAPADPAAIARLLGAGAQAPGAPAPVSPLASRFVLTGVVASPSGSGAALIAVDGRPPRPFVVGSALDQNLVLQAVEGRRAYIGERVGGPHALVLSLPPLPTK